MTYYSIQGTTSQFTGGTFLIAYVENMISYSLAMRSWFRI